MNKGVTIKVTEDQAIGLGHMVMLSGLYADSNDRAAMIAAIEESLRAIGSSIGRPPYWKVVQWPE